MPDGSVSDAVLRQQFEAWTGLRADASSDPYATLPPVAIAEVMRDVQEGTGAMQAYQEIMYGADKRDSPSACPRQLAASQ